MASIILRDLGIGALRSHLGHYLLYSTILAELGKMNLPKQIAIIIPHNIVALASS